MLADYRMRRGVSWGQGNRTTRSITHHYRFCVREDKALFSTPYRVIQPSDPSSHMSISFSGTGFEALDEFKSL